MRKYKKLPVEVSKFVIGLVLLQFFAILLISSPVYADTTSLKNDFNFVWGGPYDENIYAMESISNEIFYVAGDTSMSLDYKNNTIFLSKLNVSKLESGIAYPEWSYIYERSDARTSFRDMILDSSGNIYIAGIAHNIIDSSFTDDDIFLLKFTDEGNLEWNVTWGTNENEAIGEESYMEQPPVPGRCLVIDSMNNIYIVGKKENDALLLKFNNLGEYQWNLTWNMFPAYGGHDPSVDDIEDIQIDSNDYIYLAVLAQSFFNDTYAIFKFNIEGDLQWNTIISDLNGRSGRPVKLLLNSDGLFFCTSISDIFLAKFDPSTGEQLWSSSTNYEEWGIDIIAAEFDSLGNIIALAYDNSDDYIGKFDSDGIIQWHKTMSLVTTKPQDLYIDSEDNIYSLGTTSLDTYHIYIRKHNRIGELLYRYFWEDIEYEKDCFPRNIFVDSLGQIYVSGSTPLGGWGGYNAFFARFSPPSPPPPPPWELIIIASVIGGGAIIGIATILLIRRRRKSA